MKKSLLPAYHIPLVLLILCFIQTGCSCYPFAANRLPVINGALNPSGTNQVKTYRVIGRGLEPETAKTKAEAILMAERAAITDGYRQLVEKLHGVHLNSQLRINNGSADYDLLYSETQAWLRGAEVIKINRLSNGITEAEMVIRLNFINKNNVWQPTGPVPYQGAYSKLSAPPVCTP